MKAVLLAAGIGSRLGVLTATTPKILVNIRGRPLLDRQLSFLHGAGVSEVVINVYAHSEQVIQWLTDYAGPLRVRVSIEEELLGTAGALFPLKKDLGNQPFLVMYGDVLMSLDINSLAVDHAQHPNRVATIAVYRETSAKEGKGILDVTPSRKIVRFQEKPFPPKSGLVNAGLYLLEPRVLDSINTTPADFGRDVWPQLLREGKELGAFILPNAVLDVGTLESLALAQLRTDGV